MITYKTFNIELEQIETSLKKALQISEQVRDKFYNNSLDAGNLADRAFLFVLN